MSQKPYLAIVPLKEYAEYYVYADNKEDALRKVESGTLAPDNRRQESSDSPIMVYDTDKSPRQRATLKCPHCGSVEITIDASAKWCPEINDWELCGTMDTITCDDCGSEFYTPAEELVDV
jgi:transcription elongation factor Elf1